MKRYTIICFLLLSAGFLFAQQQAPTAAGNPDASEIGTDTAQQNLQEVSVEKFEIDGFWVPYVSYDDGYIASRLFEGGPAGKQPLQQSQQGSDSTAAASSDATASSGTEANPDTNADKYVLGAKVEFLHRGYVSFTLKPARPIPIEGITKTLSIWVAGRNYNHELKLLIQDFFGRQFELSMGKLNFQGWKQLTVAVPAQGFDGMSGIVQYNYHFTPYKLDPSVQDGRPRRGIKVVGLRIDCDPAETSGTYYVYFDDLRAVTDLFGENNPDPDDMADIW